MSCTLHLGGRFSVSEGVSGDPGSETPEEKTRTTVAKEGVDPLVTEGGRVRTLGPSTLGLGREETHTPSSRWG